VPSYARHESGSFPYLIILTDPRPSLDKGTARIYGFRVNEAFPRIPIPLAGAETLIFDFSLPYQRTFEGLSYFRNRADYSTLPPRISTYDPADRQRIEEVMQKASDSQP